MDRVNRCRTCMGKEMQRVKGCRGLRDAESPGVQDCSGEGMQRVKGCRGSEGTEGQGVQRVNIF